ncbi:MAG: hypothetical protein ABL898_14210 [Hyphomicrobiaceae bacterium]
MKSWFTHFDQTCMFTQRSICHVRGGIAKKSMIHNSATPNIQIDAETYEVRANGELLVCEPAKSLPMTQRYFLF